MLYKLVLKKKGKDRMGGRKGKKDGEGGKVGRGVRFIFSPYS